MPAMPDDGGELTRLKAAQARVRALARNHVWFGDAIRAGFIAFLELGERFQSEKAAMHQRERELARDLLGKGLLFDFKARDNSQCLFVRVEGLCPVELVDRLEEYRRGDPMPEDLEREGAAAALAAMDRDAIYRARDMPDETREAMAGEYRAAQAAKTHVSFSWRIVVSRPADWQEPPDPRSLDRADLARFTEADYRTIALYWLGGLADHGLVRPLVAKPRETGDTYKDILIHLAWRARSLGSEDPDSGQNPFPGSWIKPPALDSAALPAWLAEQMLDAVEAWAKGEALKRGETLAFGAAAVAVDHGAIETVAPGVARGLGGDNGDTKPPTLPGGSSKREEGEASPVRRPDGWTRKELIDQANKDGEFLSGTTFDTIRELARIPAGKRGQQRVFSKQKLRLLIAALDMKRFRRKVEIGDAWNELLLI